MNNDYISIPIDKSNRLINNGTTVIVATKSIDGRYNLAPIAWNCPVKKDPPMALVVVGKAHKTYDNILKSNELAICVPHADSVKTVLATGKISGSEADKYEKFNIESFRTQKIDAMIPLNSIAYLECRVNKEVDILGKSSIFIVDIIESCVKKDAFNERMLTETPQGKTIHHNGGTVFSIPGNEVIEL